MTGMETVEPGGPIDLFAINQNLAGFADVTDLVHGRIYLDTSGDYLRLAPNAMKDEANRDDYEAILDHGEALLEDCVGHLDTPTVQLDFDFRVARPGKSQRGRRWHFDTAPRLLATNPQRIKHISFFDLLPSSFAVGELPIDHRIFRGVNTKSRRRRLHEHTEAAIESRELRSVLAKINYANLFYGDDLHKGGENDGDEPIDRHFFRLREVYGALAIQAPVRSSK